MPKKTNTMTVGFPLYDGVTLMDFVGATDVFACTNGAFTPIWLAEEKRPVETSEGAFVYPHYRFKDKYPAIDILFVPGGRAPAIINNAMFNKSFQNFIKKNAGIAEWTGSVCVGAFILAAAGLLKDCTVTTYWSQISNLALLNKKFNNKIPPGYPRGVIDAKQKLFSGGGISSSVDLALMLVEKIKGKRMAQTAQLFIQYAPDPPVHAGDPTLALPLVLKAVLKEQTAFTKLYYDAVQRVLKNG